MDTSNNSIENQLTLTFLSNPLYHSNLKKHEKIGPDKLEQKFYRKRILSLHKDMLRGAIPNKDVKRIHDNYVSCLINYFKMIDKKHILQEEYNDLNVQKKNQNDCNNVDCISDANTVLMEHLENLFLILLILIYVELHIIRQALFLLIHLKNFFYCLTTPFYFH